MSETRVYSIGQEDPLEKKMATHSSIAWKIPCTEEPGRVQSVVLQSWDRTERLHFHFQPNCDTVHRSVTSCVAQSSMCSVKDCLAVDVFIPSLKENETKSVV